METTDYDVWYDSNEVDVTNHVQVLRDWARADLDISMGKVIRIGDDELDPLPARIIALDSSSGIITLEVLFAAHHAAVAQSTLHRRRVPLAPPRWAHRPHAERSR